MTKEEFRERFLKDKIKKKRKIQKELNRYFFNKKDQEKRGGCGG